MRAVVEVETAGVEVGRRKAGMTEEPCLKSSRACGSRDEGLSRPRLSSSWPTFPLKTNKDLFSSSSS
jgi:hypothetical protein